VEIALASADAANDGAEMVLLGVDALCTQLVTAGIQRKCPADFGVVAGHTCRAPQCLDCRVFLAGQQLILDEGVGASGTDTFAETGLGANCVQLEIALYEESPVPPLPHLLAIPFVHKYVLFAEATSKQVALFQE